MPRPDDPRSRHAVPGETRDDYRWVVLAVTSVGALLASLTSGTLVIALPDILRDLHTDLFTLLWIVVGYTLVDDGPGAQRRPDRRPGRARAVVHRRASPSSRVASVACALAPTLADPHRGRRVQGVGGAFLMANSAALVTDAFPRRELGRALGINAMVVGAGLILGPILGGWLTGFGWRDGLLVQRPDRHRRHDRRGSPPGRAGHAARGAAALDLAGSGLYLVGLSGLVTALAFGGHLRLDDAVGHRPASWPSSSPRPAFLWVESHRADPLLDLTLFRNRLFAMGNLTGLLNGIARNGVLFLLVFYLQGVKGVDPVTAGLMLAPLAVGLLVLSPISGVLADRYGSRGLATLGHGRDGGRARSGSRRSRSTRRTGSSRSGS